MWAANEVSTPSSTLAEQGDLDSDPFADANAPIHLEYQSKAVNFKCEADGCNKKFVRKGDLDRHSKTHQTGPKAYDCIVEQCRRKGYKGFWRLDKLKDHMDCKHPEVEVERWCVLKAGFGYSSEIIPSMYRHPSYWAPQGLRNITRREEHEAVMRSKGFEPFSPGSLEFRRVKWPAV